MQGGSASSQGREGSMFKGKGGLGIQARRRGGVLCKRPPGPTAGDGLLGPGRGGGGSNLLCCFSCDFLVLLSLLG